MVFGSWAAYPRRMSLDKTATTVWQSKQPPLGLLVAAKATELVGSDLSAELQAPFLALSRAVVSWWPKRQPAPAQLYESEYGACLAAAGEKPAAQLRPLLAGAALQMAALVKVAGRLSLPSEDFLKLDEGDFEKLLRDAAKVGRLPVAQLEARLEHLLEHVKVPWPQLVARAERMPWTRGAPWESSTSACASRRPGRPRRRGQLDRRSWPAHAAARFPRWRQAHRDAGGRRTRGAEEGRPRAARAGLAIARRSRAVRAGSRAELLG